MLILPVMLALLILLFIGKFFRGFVAAFLTLIVSVPLGAYVGGIEAYSICWETFSVGCAYSILFKIPIAVIIAYVVLLALYHTVVFKFAAGYMAGSGLILLLIKLIASEIYPEHIQTNTLITATIVAGLFGAGISILLSRHIAKLQGESPYDKDFDNVYNVTGIQGYKE